MTETIFDYLLMFLRLSFFFLHLDLEFLSAWLYNYSRCLSVGHVQLLSCLRMAVFDPLSDWQEGFAPRPILGCRSFLLQLAENYF